jgi:hypothetical protein
VPVECFSLAEFAFSVANPLSSAFLAAGALIHWLAPAVLIFFCVQVFGRAASQGVFDNPRQLRHLHGFIRWNTVIFGSLLMAAWAVLSTGSSIVVASLSNGQVTPDRVPLVTTGYGLLKAGLVLQLVMLLAFTLIVWRFKITSHSWMLQWDDQRKFTWTWKKLIDVVFISMGLLLVRQLYHVVRFFLHYTDLPWLALVFDAIPLLGQWSALSDETFLKTDVQQLSQLFSQFIIPDDAFLLASPLCT